MDEYPAWSIPYLTIHNHTWPYHTDHPNLRNLVLVYIRHWALTIAIPSGRWPWLLLWCMSACRYRHTYRCRRNRIFTGGIICQVDHNRSSQCQSKVPRWAPGNPDRYPEPGWDWAGIGQWHSTDYRVSPSSVESTSGIEKYTHPTDPNQFKKWLEEQSQGIRPIGVPFPLLDEITHPEPQ